VNVTVADEAFYAVERRMDRWMGMEGPVRAFGGEWFPEPLVRFSDVPDVQPYVDKVLAHIGCERPITVRRRRGSKFAHYEPGGVIAIPSRHNGGAYFLREDTVLHEVAHHLSRGDKHGPRFARTFVDLLTGTGHPVLARMLEIACFEAGLPVASTR
jgi:putative metallohydrolase (TIGR04338 family)